MTTNITKRNLIQILQDDPVLLEELRALLLSRELLELPQKFAEFAESANRRFDRIEQIQAELQASQAELQASQVELQASQAELQASQAELQASQAELQRALAEFVESTNNHFRKTDADVGFLKGLALETRLPGAARAQVEHYLDIRHTRVLRCVTLHNLSHDFEDAVYDAEVAGILSGRERRRILSTDMVVRGRSLRSGGAVYVAVEASFTAADGDIDRANRSAEALRKVFTDAEAAAAVYCSEVSDEIVNAAENEGVKVILNELL